MTASTNINDALILLCSVRAALRNGVGHSQDGRLLTTEADIIKAMLRGPVEIDETGVIPVTTWQDELPKVIEEIAAKAGIPVRAGIRKPEDTIN